MKLYPWQIAPYQQLTDAFRQQHGHHALLFRSETGLGSEALIRQFAHWLLCQQQMGKQPCGQCKSCLLFQADNHPDFHLIQPIENKDIGIDQIRELTAKLQQFSQQGGNSVVYITDADRLTEASANALLKTLEEPNDKIYFLLQASLQSPMLATIQSRCQTWVLHTPPHLQALEWLESEFPQKSYEELTTALRISRERPLLCKNLLETDRLQARKTFLQTFWRFYKSRDVLLLLRAFDSEKEAVLQQLEWLDSFFSDALKAKLNIASHWLNPDLHNGILPFSQQLSAPQLLKGHQILQRTAQDLRSIAAVNQELMLLDCLTQLVLTVFEGQNEPR